jgi:hypothetical protein
VTAPSARRPAGRRRRRLYWTAGILAAATVAGAAGGVVAWRVTRPEVYVPGEEHEAITRRLDRGIPAAAPEPRLVDVTSEAGLGGFRAFAGRRTSQLPEDMGSGAAWGDFDRDGDDDLFLVSAGGPLDAPDDRLAPPLLFENRGDGTFAPAAGFPDLRIRGMGAAWGDVDGDGWPDLAVSGYRELRLFRNRQGRFEEDDAFPALDGYWAGLSWSDFDRDGDLDLYVCGYVRFVENEGNTSRTAQFGQMVPYTLNPSSYEPERNLLLRNDGAGGFEDVAEALGVANPTGRSLSALWHDLDDDGWPDLYVANDISDNALFWNRGGRFEDVGLAAWVADYRGAMGLAAGDIGRDGDDDLFVSHWIAQENALYESLARELEADPAAPEGAPPRFMDVADQVGLGQSALRQVGWGAALVDLDADGWLDLAVANGSTFETEEPPRQLRPMRSFLFWSEGGRHFHDLAPEAPALADLHVSRGLAASDYDLDGDVDLLIVDLDAGVRLLRNEMPQGGWVELILVRPPGDGGRTPPVTGARVVARVGDVVLRRTVSSASYLSQHSEVVHLGLGAAAGVDELQVRWSGGGTDTWSDLEAKALWELTEGRATPRRIEPAPTDAPADAASEAARRQRVAEFWRLQRAAMDTMKERGDFSGAAGLFRRALELDPDHEDSLYYLGNCLAETEDLDGAFAALERLVAINPQSHRGHKRLGTLRAATATSRADLDAAAASLERALALNPEATGALQALGEVDLLRGDTVSAARRFDLVRQANPSATNATFLRAYIAWRDGDGELSRRLLTLARGDGEAWKPAEGVAEGETRRRMHTDVTPLQHYLTAWDGSTDPATAFASLGSDLGR